MIDLTAERLRGFGTTIFTEMSALAARTGAINLGQGFPDTDGPPEIIDAADAAMRAGANQYAPLAGVPELCDAIAGHQRRRYGLDVDPRDGVQVTFGATEAIAATMLGLLEPGDEVVVLEPFYDSYAATIAMAGASCRFVTLRPPDFAIDLDALAAAAPGARMLLLNSPHNPTGRVATAAELEAIARACVDNDLIAVTDEVYEHLVFDGTHVPLATLPGMAGRTLTISSAGKSFSFTGWKVGWCSGPPQLVAAVRSAKQFLSFAGGTPFQHAVAAALADAERHVAPLRAALQHSRDLLCEGLGDAGLDVSVPQGTYFVNADLAPLGVRDARDWCLELPARAGVVAIPTSAFYADAQAGRTLVRFAFCKRAEVIEEAVASLVAAGRDGQRTVRSDAAPHARVPFPAMAKVSGSASSDIEAPIDAVWAIVQDVYRWPEWQGTLGAITGLESDAEERATLCEMELDAKVTKIKMKLRCVYEQPSRMSFERQSGDLESLAGSWQLEDLGGAGTRATYTLDVTPGGFLNMLLTEATTDKLRRNLVDVRPPELKARAEAG